MKRKSVFLTIIIIAFLLGSLVLGSANPSGNFFLQQVSQALQSLFFRVSTLENQTQELQTLTSCIGIFEVCNGIDDNDCDGLTDSDLIQTCGTDVGECKKGIQVCSNGQYGSCIGSIGPTSEIPDGKDNDCNGIIDNLPTCGNGVLDQGETCDDGNLVNGDGCSSTCQVEQPVCGDGIIQQGEQCDDGNTQNGDGCSSSCLTEQAVCGDGVVDQGETCDDGNAIDGDGCSSTCQSE